MLRLHLESNGGPASDKFSFWILEDKSVLQERRKKNQIEGRSLHTREPWRGIVMNCIKAMAAEIVRHYKANK